MRAKGLATGVPGVPGVPELPEVAMGLEMAEELAGPVLPVLVALDWLTLGPELPEVAVGLTLRVAAPPAPPLAWPVATEGPPVAWAATLAFGLPATTLAAPPPVPEVALAAPPVPPEPPLAAAFVLLIAPPVVPDWAFDSEDAPELARLTAWPVLAAWPVSPLGAAVVGVVGVWAGVDEGMVAGAEPDAAGGADVVVLWATAAPPQNTRMAAIRAPTEADALEIFLTEPGLPVFMLIPCRWGRRRPCR
ncbi:MAG: hypothetical protein ACRDTE_24985 [Pseudonocardiaceae bacterium]